jgi:octanoyl-[GcvH]:protein N-octanoyltransferase
MSNSHGLPSKLNWLDTTAYPLTGDPLFPFAYEEAACREVAKGAPPLIHMWRHQRAFILGLRDRKLPYALEAMAWLEQQGYHVMVRHSGGAAVPLDGGVVNLSLILPKPQGVIDFRDDFETMVHIIRRSLSKLTNEVRVGEIKGSYCPGDYDLSMGGRKFCGIAQRRQTGAFIVQAFIVIEEDGERRARLVQDFYRIAQGSGLKIDISSTASISELTLPTSVSSFIDSVRQALSLENIQIAAVEDYSPNLRAKAEQLMDELRERYNKS